MASKNYTDGVASGVFGLPGSEKPAGENRDFALASGPMMIHN
jgi:hypothetical protein